MTLAAYLLGIMLAWSPPETAAARVTHREAQETAEDRTARYEGIAQALADVAEDPDEKPLYGGELGRARTAVTLLAVSWMESGWRRDVDLGVGKLARGEGVDSCLVQIRVGGGLTAEGWSHADLTGDRRRCFRAGLHLMRRSYSACRTEAPEHLLAAYASGSCKGVLGQKRSRERILLARRMLARFPAPRPEAS